MPTATLRQLIACSSCSRQWDAEGRAVGERFHCSCGTTLEVPAERSRDAAVVRCGQCGAARRAGSTACGFCEADFTVHERDLHTICPSCVARISDSARFCHHCGIAIQPQGTIGEVSVRTCPACDSRPALFRRSLGERGLAVEECHACAGLWLPTSTFGQLVAAARTGAPPPTLAVAQPAPSGAPTAPPGGTLYRPCPSCQKLMHRQNFGRRSGVIVDSCKECGLWFDFGELDRLLGWVRAGGEHVAERVAVDEQREQARRARMRLPPPDLGGRWGSSDVPVSPAVDLIGALVSWLVRPAR